MAIIKKGLKYGTALGVTYLTVNQRLWSQLSHQEINEKLNSVKKCEKQFIGFVNQKTGLDVNKWVPNTQSLELKNLWNRTIKTSFKTLSELNLSALSVKVQKMMTSFTTK